MPKNLPDRVLPWQLAHAGRVVRGQVPLARMSRLAQELLNKREGARVELVFGRDETDCCYIQGYIEARLQLICQRCLQSMEWPVNTQIRLGLTVIESEINRWPDGYEPWVIEREEVASLWGLVEDELLLALPIAARHSMDECPEGKAFKRAADGDREKGEIISERRPSPFSVLKKIKIEGKNNT